MPKTFPFIWKTGDWVGFNGLTNLKSLMAVMMPVLLIN